MEYIKLESLSEKIELQRLKDIYNTRYKMLYNTLMYFDKVGVEAAVKMNFAVIKRRLHTMVEITCKDEEFKDTLVKATEGFNKQD